MWIPWLPQEYTRTCLECGEAWQVPRAARRRQVRSIRLTARGVAASSIPQQVTSIMADNEGERIFAHCPNCGADRFTEHAVRGGNR